MINLEYVDDIFKSLKTKDTGFSMVLAIGDRIDGIIEIHENPVIERYIAKQAASYIAWKIAFKLQQEFEEQIMKGWGYTQ